MALGSVEETSLAATAALICLAGQLAACRVTRESDPTPTETAPVASASAPITSASVPPPPPPPPPPPVEAPPGALVLAIGGIDSHPEQSGAAEHAVDAATQSLVSGATPFEAVVAGTVALEDEPTLNAGTGSRLPLNGDRPQMDAAVMDSSGRFGAVCALEDVKNPVAVAAKVVTTPHLLLCGAGAVAFARDAGFDTYDTTTELRRRERDALVTELMGAVGNPFGDVLRRAEVPGGGGASPATAAGGAAPHQEGDYAGGASADDAEGGGDDRGPGSDTVAVVVRSADGGFAVGASSGGPAASLVGRVGDVPVLGAALFAGPAGAVALSGRGEDIVRAQFARRIYERLDGGDGVDEAATWALELVGDDEAIAIVIVGRKGHRLEMTRPVAWALRNAEGVQSGAPAPPAPAPTPGEPEASAAPVTSATSAPAPSSAPVVPKPLPAPVPPAPRPAPPVAPAGQGGGA